MSASFVATRRLLAPLNTTTRGPQSVAEALRRNELARRQAQRRELKKREKHRADTERELRRERSHQESLVADRIRKARRVRKEDFELGPLAPRRDVGALETTYGTVDPRMVQPGDIPKWKRKWCPFMIGDRVVVIEGRDKGTISTVKYIDEESQTLRADGLNQVDMAVPEFQKLQQQDSPDVQTYTLHLPMASVRLVYPLPDPVTGQRRDVIIENLERRVDWYDDAMNITHYKRVVPELDDQEIPWPPVDEPVFNDNPDDTLRIQTEQVTFEGQDIPLLSPPMPMAVLDELRNKHSKLSRRRVQDPDYQEKLKAREEAAWQKNIDMMAAMRTPLQELHALQASHRKQSLQSTTGTVVEEPATTFLDVREDKPWKRKVTYDAKKAWKMAWEEEKMHAAEEGRKAKRPPKTPRQQEQVDDVFLEQLGALMAEQGLGATQKAVKRA